MRSCSSGALGSLALALALASGVAAVQPRGAERGRPGRSPRHGASRRARSLRRRRRGRLADEGRRRRRRERRHGPRVERQRRRGHARPTHASSSTSGCWSPSAPISARRSARRRVDLTPKTVTVRTPEAGGHRGHDPRPRLPDAPRRGRGAGGQSRQPPLSVRASAQNFRSDSRETGTCTCGRPSSIRAAPPSFFAGV